MTGVYVVWMREDDEGFYAQVEWSENSGEPRPEYFSMQELLRGLPHDADAAYNVNVFKHNGIWVRLCVGVAYEEAVQYVRAYYLGRLMQ